LWACGNKGAGTDGDEEKRSSVDVNKSGMPIVEEEIDMTIFAYEPAQNEENDRNDSLIWQHYSNLTNINSDYTVVKLDALDVIRNLALGSGKLPDAFFLSQLTNSDILKYGEQGMFITLNDLIDEYAPNLTALMEDDPSIRKAMTFPDGNIYSLPALIVEDFLSLHLSARPWITVELIDDMVMDKS